jgi:hypothetical protein
MKPDLFIIGAARSGTTSLYSYLDQHPDIFFSEVKEINFFSNPDVWVKGFEWYESHFQGQNNSKKCGEASTSYTVSPFLTDAPRRIWEYNPNAKLIYIVREPIERLVSHYMHRLHRGIERRPFIDLVDNLENESTAWQGRYYYQLTQYMEFFDCSKIKVITFDTLKKSPKTVIREIFDFLNVDSDFLVKKPEKVFNSSEGTQERSLFGISVLRFYRRHVEQKRIPYILKKQFLNVANIGSRPHEKPRLSSEERKTIAEFYKEDLTRLSDRFDIDVSGWINGE